MEVLLISERTIKEINHLSQQCFWLNRVVDRAVSVLSVGFSCSKASEILHEGLAHKYPLLADDVNSILDMYNEGIVYLETRRDDRDYEDLSEIFQTILDENIRLYDLARSVYKVANEEGDFNVSAHMSEFMRKLNKFMNQVILLRDKAVLMNNDPAMFDFAIPTFFVL